MNPRYEIILADPPWNESGGGRIKRGADRHYPLMKTADIKDIWLDIADDVAPDSILFLWVTNNFLEDGLAVMRTWGYTYKTNFVWVKDRQGLGFYARGQHELCLVGVKGAPPRSRRGSNGGSNGHSVPPSVLHAPRQAHSRKPESFYEIVESFKSTPTSPCLELFARRERAGWTSWGNELGVEL